MRSRREAVGRGGAGASDAPLKRAREWAGRKSVRWLAAVAALGCIVVFVRIVDVRAMLQEAARANVGWLLVATLANFMLLPLLTSQWLALMPRDGAVNRAAVWEALAISIAAMNTLPLGGGHAVAVGVLVARGITSVGGAVSLLALEQVFEGISRVMLLGIAVSVAPLPAAVAQGAGWLVAGMVIALTVAWRFARQPRRARAATHWRTRLQRYLGALRQPGAFTFALLMSVGVRICGVAAVWGAQHSVDAPYTLRDAIVVYTSVVFGTGVSLSPGNAGTYELVAIAAYRLLGKTGSLPAAVAVLAHITFLAPILLTGWGIALWRMVRPAEVVGETRREV